jgi:hypothetical protein
MEMYEMNEIDGMIEAIAMVMDEHGIMCEDGHWLTEDELLRLSEAEVRKICNWCYGKD